MIMLHDRHGEQLQQLSVGNSVQILPDYLQQEVLHQDHRCHWHHHIQQQHHHLMDDQGTFSDPEDDGVGGNVYQRQGFIIRAPNLK